MDDKFSFVEGEREPLSAGLCGGPSWIDNYPDMRVPNSVLDGVCFLGVVVSGGADAGKFLCLGTAFLVGMFCGDEVIED